MSLSIKHLPLLALLGCVFGALPVSAATTPAAFPVPEYSTAGFYALPDTGRTVYSMNPAWKRLKGAAAGAEAVGFDDSAWATVSLPDGLEILPEEASGGRNYQGIAWYRKHFKADAALKGKRVILHFEAIMGISRVWINGKPAVISPNWAGTEHATVHYGGYLPVIADVTNLLNYGADNVIAVQADNRNNGIYPPGKPQETLDFCYFGGIYRDCWLIAHNPVYITDENAARTPAGGGVFVTYPSLSEAQADVAAKTQLRNASASDFIGSIRWTLAPRGGAPVATATEPLTLKAGAIGERTGTLRVQNPALWSPDSPSLYDLDIAVLDANGKTVDGYRRRIGLRSVAFNGKDGFILNGKPYPYPMIGGNRHQDFAVIGNALSNSLHWRDAKKLREAGMRVIRNAHYPQDPAFMDACDALGLMLISTTPGWQFWNGQPIFMQRVLDDIRNMVRRDRNRPSIWCWEPILNETWYPKSFAADVRNLVQQEMPGSESGCDAMALGHEVYTLRYMHPNSNTPAKDSAYPKLDDGTPIPTFTREWGDNVDDWGSHNSPSRVSRSWGEVPMLVQAKGYAKPDYPYTCYDTLYRTSRRHMGGCLWHPFDHQRGYHPDPFYGGILDAFRQPKYSYYMFAAQRPAAVLPKVAAETGPMVYIAHAMTPFSPADVTVYSNCDEVRLTYNKGSTPMVYKKAHAGQTKFGEGMPAPVITFKNVFDVMKDKALDRSGRSGDSYLYAEGLMDGKVVATHKVRPARRPGKLVLTLDDEGIPPRADGSDLAVVIASVTDGAGNVKRLNNETVRFSVTGPAELVADAATGTNPRKISWGTAPVLVRMGTVPGKITVTAQLVTQGGNTIATGALTLESAVNPMPTIADAETLAAMRERQANPAVAEERAALERLLNVMRSSRPDDAHLNGYAAALKQAKTAEALAQLRRQAEAYRDHLAAEGAKAVGKQQADFE